MLFGQRSSLGSTLPTLQDPVSNPGRNSCLYCGKKKPGGREEGKQECRLLRQITKSPPMPLILHPLQSNITVPVSVCFPLLPPPPPFFSFLFYIATTPRIPWIDRSIHMQSLSKLQMFSSLVFFFFASTTDGEFLRHETRRERLTNCRMEGKEKSITKLLRLSSTPFVLMVRCPEPSVEVEIGPEQAEMTGLVLERIQVGEGSICFSVRA